MPSQTSLFPKEVDKYDINILRELLNNAIAHQDYRRCGRINIIEMKDKVMIINEGSFIPKSVDTLIVDEGYVPPYYRNPFLAQAMVNLNMIDTAGMGIRRSFEKLRERFFPMPDYDLSEENRVLHHPILGDVSEYRYVIIYCDGKPIEAIEGEPIASALMSAGIRSFRTTAKRNEPRGVFCAIGRCTDCMMIVDGKPNTRTCITPVREGMKVETQYGLG